MTQKNAKMIYKAVGFSLIVLCFVLSFVYRPYAYSHHLNDFHLADSYTSFFGVPLGVCFTQAYRSGKEKWSIPKNILYVTLLLIGWELIDGFFAKKLDWVDISACMISGCLMYVLYLIVGFKPPTCLCHCLSLQEKPGKRNESDSHPIAQPTAGCTSVQ